MFLAVYETRRVPFNDGAVYVTHYPTGTYVAVDEDSDCIGFGDTPMAAIADYNAAVQE